MTNDALNAIKHIETIKSLPHGSTVINEECDLAIGYIRAALAPVDVEGLKREADAAYCTALDLADKNCRGAQYKLENGKFSNDDLKWHCQHNERIGYHRGMWRVLKELDHLAARGCFGVPEGYALVPIEPTINMCFIGGDVLSSLDENLTDNFCAEKIYKAMIKAAPKKEGGL